MKINYKLDESDFLTHQLYVGSKSEHVRKNRHRIRITVPILYFAFALFLYWNNKLILAVGFVVFGIIWYVINPIWEKRRYIKHYKIFVNDKFKGRFGKLQTLEFTEDCLLAREEGSESKISTSEVEEICEIPTIVLIHLKGGKYFILPKNKISDIGVIIENLKKFAERLQIKYTLEEKWEWK